MEITDEMIKEAAWAIGTMQGRAVDVVIPETRWDTVVRLARAALEAAAKVAEREAAE